MTAPNPSTEITHLLEHLDKMNAGGELTYDAYSNLHDLVSLMSISGIEQTKGVGEESWAEAGRCLAAALTASLNESDLLRTVIAEALAYMKTERWDDPDFDPAAILAKALRP